MTNRPAPSMAGLALSFLSKFFQVLLLQFSSNVVARVRSCLPLAGLLLLGRAQDEAISVSAGGWAFDHWYATLLCRMSTLAAHEVSA